MTGKLQTDTINPLSSDIRFLGNLLGRVIREQHSEAAFALVERVRASSRERRRDGSAFDSSATSALMAMIDALDLDSARVLIKAFSNYFQLINIAEDVQRIRVLRQREREQALEESLDAAVRALVEHGLSAAQVRAMLAKICVRLVLTAHPSEAKRKEILVKLRQIARMMERRDREALTLLPREHDEIEAALLEEIEELWQTRPTRTSRATVADEVDFGLYFVTTTIMDVVIDFYAELGATLARYYPGEDWTNLPPLLRYASWIGGDRDGNPNVTADVTLTTLATLRRAAQSAYLHEIAFLRDHLTQATSEITVSEALRAVVRSGNTKYPGEYYRQKLDEIYGRLEGDGYPTSADLLADLELIASSLRENKGLHVANGEVRRLIQKVRLFGLHLVPLEIREDARRFATAIDELFRAYGLCENFNALPETEKQTLLTREIASKRPLFPFEPSFSAVTNQVIDTWRMIAAAHRQYGKACIDTVIASMSQTPGDVLTMLLFASEVGVERDVDLVPLFETVDDLRCADEVMEGLFANPVYARYLAGRGMRQQIMIGYSDSNKDGGYLSSNWNLYVAQGRLTKLCEAHGVALELFHGRGGSIGRGGGPTNHAILSAPPSSGRIKITEQGEVIAYRYGNPQIARRHLHQVMNAMLIALGTPINAAPRPEWLAAMEQLSQIGQIAYRALVYETPGFLDYWQQATPIDELSALPISSRPAKRRAGGFEGLRAIPWVFSWMQCRAIIPSWYGVGYALEQYAAMHGIEVLTAMYNEWPFFHTLIQNVQLDLAKADMGIAALYAALVENTLLRDTIFTGITDEHARACKLICQVTGQQELLDYTPVIRRSIERRNPYVDPLNFIQVSLLRKLRALPPDSPEREATLEAVLSTINGIAAGMKTTG